MITDKGFNTNDFARYTQLQRSPYAGYRENDGARANSASTAGFGGGWGNEMGGADNDFGGTAGIVPDQTTQLRAGDGSRGVQYYAAGGAIDEATGDVGMGPMAGSFSQQLSAAVKAVRDTLAEGRRRYGVDQEKQEASLNRIPTRPGTQSESGREPEQPMPGPLPPARNPFGKRAETEEDEQQEAIPTDDEETA